jgi:hypothetical protein
MIGIGKGCLPWRGGPEAPGKAASQPRASTRNYSRAWRSKTVASAGKAVMRRGQRDHGKSPDFPSHNQLWRFDVGADQGNRQELITDHCFLP